MTREPRMLVKVKREDIPGRPKCQVAHLSDETNGVRVIVVPDAGGEISSIRVRSAGRWHEILYRALDYKSNPPDRWQGRAPLLWPAAGGCYTKEQLKEWGRTGERPKESRYAMDGKSYPIPMHGFARFFPWRLTAAGSGAKGAWVRCTLASSDETRQVYPFDFEVNVTHKLANGRIISLYEVEAGDNKKPMPFTIGNHIAFRLPFTGRGKFLDCTMRTLGNKECCINSGAQLTGRTKPVALARPTHLDRPELRNGVFTGYARRNAWVDLMDPASFSLRVSQVEKRVGGCVRVPAKDIFFVFYGKTDIGYYCPEPWMGWINALNTGKGAIVLAPRERFAWEMRVSFRGR